MLFLSGDFRCSFNSNVFIVADPAKPGDRIRLAAGVFGGLILSSLFGTGDGGGIVYKKATLSEG